MTQPTEADDQAPDTTPKTIATPEGDNEYPPDAPLKPTPDEGLQRPRGNEPHPAQPIRPALD